MLSHASRRSAVPAGTGSCSGGSRSGPPSGRAGQADALGVTAHVAGPGHLRPADGDEAIAVRRQSRGSGSGPRSTGRNPAIPSDGSRSTGRGAGGAALMHPVLLLTDTTRGHSHVRGDFRPIGAEGVAGFPLRAGRDLARRHVELDALVRCRHRKRWLWLPANCPDRSASVSQVPPVPAPGIPRRSLRAARYPVLDHGDERLGERRRGLRHRSAGAEPRSFRIRKRFSRRPASRA